MEIGLRNPDIGSLAGYLTIEDSSKRSVGYQALADVIARFLITFKDKEEKGIYDINNQKFINCFLNMLNEATIIDMSYLKFLIKESLKEYFAEKGTLNEGTTLRQIGLSEGKIKLVDNKGNIYLLKNLSNRNVL